MDTVFDCVSSLSYIVNSHSNSSTNYNAEYMLIHLSKSCTIYGTVLYLVNSPIDFTGFI